MAHLRYRINLLASERTILEQLIRAHNTPQLVARRVRIVLLANGGGTLLSCLSGWLG